MLVFTLICVKCSDSLLYWARHNWSHLLFFFIMFYDKKIYYHFFHLMVNDNSQDVYLLIVFLVNECLQLFLVHLSIISWKFKLKLSSKNEFMSTIKSVGIDVWIRKTKSLTQLNWLIIWAQSGKKILALINSV